MKLFFSCEHGGNAVPAAYRKSFTGSAQVLHSHRGWDPRALPIAKFLSANLKADLIFEETSRLLIDLNRSLDSDELHSPFLTDLPQLKKKLVNDVYLPYREKVRRKVESLTKKGQPVAHFSIHSFTPIRRGVKRECEIGLLFDPKRKWETQIAARLRKALESELPHARVRMNYPYKGTGDGQTSDLRAQFADALYSGIEIEFNQGWLKAPPRAPDLLGPAIARALQLLVVQE